MKKVVWLKNPRSITKMDNDFEEKVKSRFIIELVDHSGRLLLRKGIHIEWCAGDYLLVNLKVPAN